MLLIPFVVIVVMTSTLYYILWVIVRRKKLTCRILSMFALSALIFGDQFYAAFYEWRYNSANCELKVYERPNNVHGFISSGGPMVEKYFLESSGYDWIEGPASGKGDSMMVSRRLKKESNG